MKRLDRVGRGSTGSRKSSEAGTVVKFKRLLEHLALTFM